MIVEGTAYWASIKEPNTTFEPMYTVNLVVDEEIANDFASRGHNIKQMDEGSAIVIKRKDNGPNGMVRNPPKLVDENKITLIVVTHDAKLAELGDRELLLADGRIMD